MREILFRGFHENENGKETIYINGREIKGEWVEGFYSRVTNNFEQKNVHFITRYKDLPNGETVLTGQYIIEPETVGQYTGLTDKNGKKIFEGDIVKSFEYDDTYIIRYFDDENYPAFDCVPDIPLCECNGLAFLVNTEGCEAIGNVHDNPKLLEVKE